LIKGWQIGIPLMKKGGKATFYVPSELGYGGNDMGAIPPNSILIFDIELIDVK
jgi:FKBP-type peptidyl-prolyl cis-trans isomerase FkpA/FKBP-type peptidyl-prolyl cis-trans isomerase FklB